MKHIKDINILTQEHHGGLPHHSTMKAKAIIDYYGTKSMDTEKQDANLSTDLSTAFDTVDHQIIIWKLTYYGLKDKELKVFESYQKERMGYVQRDVSKSRIIELGPYGVCYSKDTNEVPGLHKILFNQRMM